MAVGNLYQVLEAWKASYSIENFPVTNLDPGGRLLISAKEHPIDLFTNDLFRKSQKYQWQLPLKILTDIICLYYYPRICTSQLFYISHVLLISSKLVQYAGGD